MSSPEQVLNAETIAAQQRQLGDEWADLYAAQETPLKTAEIALRNPVVYLRNVSLSSLPEGQREGWSAFLENTDKLVELAKTTENEWAADTNGLDKLQNLMFSGSLDPKYREPIAQKIREASTLFADSSDFRSGNTAYFAGNVRAMDSWRRLVK